MRPFIDLIEQAMSESFRPSPQLQSLKAQVDKIAEQAAEQAGAEIRAVLTAAARQYRGHTFSFHTGMGAMFIEIDPPIEMAEGENEDYFDQVDGFTRAATREGKDFLQMCEQVLGLADYVEDTFKVEVEPIEVRRNT